jgi:hypothetical protein
MKSEKWWIALVEAERGFFDLLVWKSWLFVLFEFPDSTVMIMVMNPRYSICPNTLSQSARLEEVASRLCGIPFSITSKPSGLGTYK